jgi:hypothetical protein
MRSGMQLSRDTIPAIAETNTMKTTKGFAVLTAAALAAAQIGCGNCPLSQFDTNANGIILEEEIEAAQPAFRQNATDVLEDNLLFFSCFPLFLTSPALRAALFPPPA